MGKQDRAVRLATRCDTLRTTLIQGLHGKDTILLDTALSQGDLDIIEGCVKALPSNYAVLLLSPLLERLQSRPNKGPLLLNWLKYILLYHASALLSASDSAAKLTLLMDVLELRLSANIPLLQVSGKLDLLLSQIENKSLTQSFNAFNAIPLQTYTEAVDDADYTAALDAETTPEESMDAIMDDSMDEEDINDASSALHNSASSASERNSSSDESSD
jgi:hypothetical protein